MKHRLLISIAILGFLAGLPLACSQNFEQLPQPTQSTLEQPQRITIFTLHPYPHSDEGKPKGSEDDFHGYRILDTATVAEAEDRIELMRLVRLGIDRSNGMVAACFDPRHGFRVTRDGKTVDLVVCYECLQIYMYESGAEQRDSVLTDSSVEPAISEIFERHGLSLHRQK